MSILRKMYTNYICLKYLMNEEKTSMSKLGLGKRIKYLTHGFSSEKYRLYNLAKNDYKLYLSDFQRRKTSTINKSHSIVINDKNLFEKLLKNDDITAENYGYVRNGQIYLNNKCSKLADLMEIVKDQEHIIIKKMVGGGGKGIFKISHLNNNIYIDDEIVSYEKFESFISSLERHIIQQYIIQASYSNNIYSGTINTIRILTMRDPDTKEAFIATAVHKFGSEKTKPVDNVWKGGMTALVDLDTGMLQKAAYHHSNNKKIEWKETHPDTNEKIEGTVIPNWENVKSTILNLTNELSYLNYVGWDAVVTDDGVKVIEGNNYSDVNILQIHQPLLNNEKVKRFYKYHGIIK